MEKTVHRFERMREKRNNYENHYKSTLDFPDNTEYFDKYMLEILIQIL